MRRAQNADNHAHKQHRLSQNIFPVGSSYVLVIASHMHLEPESEKRGKNVHIHTTKNIHTFLLFLDEFLPNDLRPIYCSLTTVHPSRPRHTCWLSVGAAARHGTLPLAREGVCSGQSVCVPTPTGRAVSTRLHG